MTKPVFRGIVIDVGQNSLPCFSAEHRFDFLVETFGLEKTLKLYDVADAGQNVVNDIFGFTRYRVFKK